MRWIVETVSGTNLVRGAQAEFGIDDATGLLLFYSDQADEHVVAVFPISRVVSAVRA